MKRKRMPQQFLQNPLNQFEPERLPVGWPWRIFIFSGGLFTLAVLTYFGLVFGYKPFLESRISELDGELNKLAGVTSVEEREEFARAYSRLANAKGLLQSHTAAHKIFPLLERITNQRVNYSTGKLAASGRELELGGFAQSYLALSEQLEAFKQATEIESYLLDQSQKNEDSVQFKVTLKLKENALK